MSAHLIIDGNAVYEVDEECLNQRYGAVRAKGDAQKQAADGGPFMGGGGNGQPPGKGGAPENL